jgi:hypothetical protein
MAGRRPQKAQGSSELAFPRSIACSSHPRPHAVAQIPRATGGRPLGASRRLLAGGWFAGGTAKMTRRVRFVPLKRRSVRAKLHHTSNK